MFSIKTNQRILDSISKFQKGVNRIDPLIKELGKKDSKIMFNLNLQDHFKQQYFLKKAINKINKEYNKNNNFSPTVDNLVISFVLATSLGGEQVPYLTTSVVFQDKDIKKMEKTLKCTFVKLTDNLYKIKGYSKDKPKEPSMDKEKKDGNKPNK